MDNSSQPGSLVREIHQLSQGPERDTLEEACREWLEGRRRAIKELPPCPELREGETPRKALADYRELSRLREGRLDLPWPLDGRKVSFAGYCAVLAIYHDANCTRCTRRPLFPMPQDSGDLSGEEVNQATYDGASWVLLRDAIAENPDADAMQDALEAVRAELRRRGVLSESPPTSPAVKPSEPPPNTKRLSPSHIKAYRASLIATRKYPEAKKQAEVYKVIQDDPGNLLGKHLGDYNLPPKVASFTRSVQKAVKHYKQHPDQKLQLFSAVTARDKVEPKQPTGPKKKQPRYVKVENLGDIATDILSLPDGPERNGKWNEARDILRNLEYPKDLIVTLLSDDDPTALATLAAKLTRES